MSQVGRPDVPSLRENAATLRDTQHVSPSSSALIPRIIGIALMLLIVVLNGIGLIVWSLIFVRRLPMTLFFLIAMLVAIILARRHPKVSLLTCLALGIDLIESFVYFALARSTSLTTAQYQALALVDDFFLAGIIILLTAAVLSQRSPQPDPNPVNVAVR